jgi:ketosteroid isomerase-like protein
MTTDINQILDRWTEAERRGDAGEMDGLLAEDFVGIGPVGFVLDRAAWLGRLGSGLTYDELRLDEVGVHRHGGTALVVAHQHADGHAGEVPLPPDTRVTFTIVGDESDEPRIAGVQYSFIGAPLGAHP